MSQRSRGPVLVTGDFNGHLGSLGGTRGCGNPNTPGLTLKDFIDRNSLFVASLGETASGPVHTYSHGPTQTTIDYVLVNDACSFLTETCFTHEEHPLNTSDHLPVTTTLRIPSDTTSAGTESKERINWKRAQAMGETLVYTRQVDDALAPLIGNTYDDIQQVNEEISTVAQFLVNCSRESLPIQRQNIRPRSRIHDAHLKALCVESKQRWRLWKNAESPHSGPLYVQKNIARNNVKKYLNHCRAKAERSRLLKTDTQFYCKDQTRFQRPGRRKATPSKLRINGEVVTDKHKLLDSWVNHFSSLATSLSESNPALAQRLVDIEELLGKSFTDEEFILDTPFTIEEVDAAVSKLQNGKAAGHDHVTPEHLKFGGASLKKWLCQIFNEILSQETIPAWFQQGILIPCYKGKGKDPLVCNSYRGITLLPVLSKVLERVVLQRNLPEPEDRVIPHTTEPDSIPT